MIYQLTQGDTPAFTPLVYGNPNGIAEDALAPWTCTSAIVDSSRNTVSEPRPVTDTALDEGLTVFVASMTKAEAETMVNTFDRNRPAGYFWLVTVENPNTGYTQTQTFEFAVLKR